MNEKLVEEIREYLLENSEERLDICRQINDHDGSMDFSDAIDLEEVASYTDAYELARSIIFGNVKNVEDLVRYNGYDNLESVSEDELEEESKDYINEIIKFIKSYGTQYIYNSDLEEMIEDIEE